ncbi:hypothetical protein LINGRAHAP2_LOCUS34856 [Linum grandiflorum]
MSVLELSMLVFWIGGG